MEKWWLWVKGRKRNVRAEEKGDLHDCARASRP